jgi:septal ring factor EnvC (AmiA/AmiB activator)
MSHLQPHQQRVIEERSDLAQSLERLRAFIRSEACAQLVAEDERGRLVRQAVYMGCYLQVLDERIAAFPSQRV